MTALRLDRLGLNVSDLPAAIAFYETALGFSAAAIEPGDAALLGVVSVRRAVLRRGRHCVELPQCSPPGGGGGGGLFGVCTPGRPRRGAAYPDASAGNDLWFQHCALATDDMTASYARLRAAAFTPISRNGPQALPGGIVAFKFRDPDGHPLELIQFPAADPATAGGIDHSAISVGDVGRSVAFYAAELGLTESARQVNTGPAQDALDGLAGVTVDVVALAPEVAAPHVELLSYRTPRGRAGPPRLLSDIATARLVFQAEHAAGKRVLRDPDGHVSVIA